MITERLKFSHKILHITSFIEHSKSIYDCDLLVVSSVYHFENKKENVSYVILVEISLLCFSQLLMFH